MGMDMRTTRLEPLPEGADYQYDDAGYGTCVESDEYGYEPTVEDAITATCDGGSTGRKDSIAADVRETADRATPDEPEVSSDTLQRAYGTIVDSSPTDEERAAWDALVDYADADRDGAVSETEFIAVYQCSVGTTIEGVLYADERTYAEAAAILEHNGLNPQRGYGLWRDLGILLQNAYGYAEDDKDNRVVIAEYDTTSSYLDVASEPEAARPTASAETVPATPAPDEGEEESVTGDENAADMNEVPGESALLPPVAAKIFNALKTVPTPDDEGSEDEPLATDRISFHQRNGEANGSN